MSPEQARGKPVDKRADIWAFGAVLFEMLTGKRAFDGEDISLTLADVMRAEPAWEQLPKALPPSLQTYLKRCLQKEATQRVQAIGDVRLAMEGAFETTVSAQSAPAAVPQLPLWQGECSSKKVTGAAILRQNSRVQFCYEILTPKRRWTAHERDYVEELHVPFGPDNQVMPAGPCPGSG